MLPQLDIRLLTFDVSRIDSHWGTRDHCDPYWRLYVNNSPGAYLELAGGQHVIVPNRIHLVPAWVRLHCRSRSVTDHFYVHFDVMDLSGPIVRELFREPRVLRKTAGYADLVKPIVSGQSSPLQPSLATIMYVKSLVYDAFANLLAGLPASQLERLQQLVIGNRRFAGLARHIENHLGQPLDNGLLAKRAHMSKSHFIRCFREAFGQTPALYVMEKRVAAAAKRLRLSDCGIDRIAHELGFANRFYFTRVFTRLMGISPASYRKATVY